ncbi:AAA family ATPase [Mucilaginibacter sp. 3215]|uniref:AAA family ATPase n=1 Tax=Mucilaginibacter sp. 3215 TaxID=3373912 RepID=UPI003D1E8ABE
MNKLLYIYIENYEGFAPIEICFSNNFDINFDEDGTLNILKKTDHVGDLYGHNIEDINMIAGENGVGKTTLLKLIAAISREKDSYQDSYTYDYIQVVQTASNQVDVFVSIKNHKFNVVNSPGIEHELHEDPTYEPGRSVIYYSPFLDFNMLELSSDEDSPQPAIDISATQIIMDDIDDPDDDNEANDSVLPSSLLAHKVKNIKRQLAFVKGLTDKFTLPFDVPEKFWISFHRVHPDKDDLSQEDYDLYSKLQALCATFFREYPENKMTKKTMGQLMFLRNLVSLYFRSLNKIKTSSILTHRFKNFDVKEVAEHKSDDPDDLISLILKFFTQQEIYDRSIFSYFVNIVFKAINGKNVSFESANTILNLKLDLSDDLIDNVFSMLNAPYEENERRHLLPGLSGFISFDWSNVSSGQKAFLDLFSRLYDARKKLKAVSDPVLMIIDEGEMGFHPDWQIKYIETLTTYFNNFFGTNDFQLLLATHSPLVLSDFPKERVHLLKVDKTTGLRNKVGSIGTFAQNTNELLANDFFIQSSLIGNIARNFINRILKDIAELKAIKVKKAKSRSIMERIELVDEPVIRQLLINELERSANA